MADVTPRLSIDLQPLPLGAEPWRLDPEELSILRRTLDETGDFQQPYAALVDPDDADAGSVDAYVEVSAVQLEDGTPAILIEDDGAEAITRYVVLEREWQTLPAGTLLQGAGPGMAVVTLADDDASGMQAQGMLGFLDLLVAAPALPSSAEPRPDADPVMDDPGAFLEAFTPSTIGVSVDESTRTHWRGRLPDTLLALWQRDGLARYLEGRMMLVRPECYATVLATALVGSPLEGVDTFHVYAITAFGQLLVCGENTAVEIIVDPCHGQVAAHASMLAPSTAEERNARLRLLLTLLEVHDFDVTDAQGRSVYAMTRDRVGALAAGEIYTPDLAGLSEGWEVRLVRQDALEAWQTLRTF